MGKVFNFALGSVAALASVRDIISEGLIVSWGLVAKEGQLRGFMHKEKWSEERAERIQQAPIKTLEEELGAWLQGEFKK